MRLERDRNESGLIIKETAGFNFWCIFSWSIVTCGTETFATGIVAFLVLFAMLSIVFSSFLSFQLLLALHLPIPLITIELVVVSGAP